MTNEELAKHWGVSLEEVRRISDFMNSHYFLSVAKHKTTGLFHGVMYEMREDDGERLPSLVLSSEKGFKTKGEAAQYWNDCCDTWKMPKTRAEILLRVPVDAFKALQKIDLPRQFHHKNCVRQPFAGRGSRE